MFTIEHEFDATVVTLVDEGQTMLQEDIIVNSFEECVTLEQHDPQTDRRQRICFSIAQIRDLAAALSLPEGIYSRFNEDEDVETAMTQKNMGTGRA